MPKAEDFFAQGFRFLRARDVFPGDDYLASFVERVEMHTCQARTDLGNGRVELDGVQYMAEQGMWIRKHF